MQRSYMLRSSHESARPSPLRASFNAAIAEELAVLAAAGRHVALVDMYTPFVETPDYQNVLLFDRLHPNDTGYAIMAGVWYEAIRALLPSAAAASP